MKLGTSILLAAGASIGTAFIIDKVTDGAVRTKLGEIKDQIIDNDLIDEEINDPYGPITMMTEVEESGSDFDVLENCDTGEKKVLMSYDSAMDILDFTNRVMDKFGIQREPEDIADKLGIDNSNSIVFAIDGLEDILENDLYPETVEDYLNKRDNRGTLKDDKIEDAEAATTLEVEETTEE